jgi:hypothetical protein
VEVCRAIQGAKAEAAQHVFLNDWFAESPEVADPSTPWVQTPKGNEKAR